MRAFRLFLILGAALLALSSCGKTDISESSTALSAETESKAEQSDIINGNKTLEEDGYMITKKMNPDGTYTLSLSFAEAEYKSNGQPFSNHFADGDITLEVDKTYSGRAAEISYTKREGGTYIYCNNPEMLAAEDIGQALLRTEKLSGDCMFTFEHSNHTGTPIRLGYQLLNEGDTDAVVKITNIGLQVDGEWLGQRSWSDYFNYRFELPDDYFNANGSLNPIYVGCDYVNYTPRAFEPVTVTIPAGEYIYVLGGTSEDAYGNANIGHTADKYIYNGKCSNGAVKFCIESGSVTGTFYCYTDASQVKAKPAQQGYIVKRTVQATGVLTDYSKQYKGVDPTSGLIESDLMFVFDDSTKKGNLPVWYTKMSDPAYNIKNTPYAEYSLTERTVKNNYWVTSLNPNSASEAIGSDMMVFNCVDTNGNPIVIDNNRADASGDPANTGNWMVQYTDNMTFVNAGSEARTLRIYKRGNGVLFTMARDESGNILCAKALTSPYSFGSLSEVFAGVDKSLLIQKNGRYWFKTADGKPYCDVIDEKSEVIEITVSPMSVVRLSVDSVILGNSNGGIRHWIEID